MQPDTSKSFNLPWNQSERYWLYVLLREEAIAEPLEKELRSIGMRKVKAASSYFMMQTGQAWDREWKKIHDAILQAGIDKQVTISVIPGAHEPGSDDIFLNRRSLEAINLIADNLWVGEALEAGQVVCHLQPVMDKRGKVFGYESFARIEVAGGETVGGGKIIKAGKALNIEYMLDRYLHVQAIRTFISGDGEGFLFVNFVPGFIHLPEKYLGGLTEAAQCYGVASKHIVLDFIHAEQVKDIAHLKRVCDYCRMKGYSIALDDVQSIETANRLLAEIKPDFVKLDIALIRNVSNPENLALIGKLVELCKKFNCTVLAEGVESEQVYLALLAAGVDLFQGYYFSPPTAVTIAGKSSQHNAG